MSVMNKFVGRFPLGVWFAVVAILLLFMAWGIQAYSLLNWDRAVELGIQNERFSGDTAERAWAQESRGLAVADLLWPLPIGIVALVGIFRKKLYGLVAGSMELAIGVYFPLFFAFQRWSTFRATAITAICLWMVPSLLGLVGLWANRDSFRK